MITLAIFWAIAYTAFGSNGYPCSLAEPAPEPCEESSAPEPLPEPSQDAPSLTELAALQTRVALLEAQLSAAQRPPQLASVAQRMLQRLGITLGPNASAPYASSTGGAWATASLQIPTVADDRWVEINRHDIYALFSSLSRNRIAAIELVVDTPDGHTTTLRFDEDRFRREQTRQITQRRGGGASYTMIKWRDAASNQVVVTGPVGQAPAELRWEPPCGDKVQWDARHRSRLPISSISSSGTIKAVRALYR